MREDYAVQAVKEIPYGRWREYDPEDTIRFYSLRLHEGAMIKSSPQKIIARERIGGFERAEEGTENVKSFSLFAAFPELSLKRLVLFRNTTQEHARGVKISKRPKDQWSRREFLSTVAAAGTGALFGAPSETLAAEPPLETTRIRLSTARACVRPRST